MVPAWFPGREGGDTMNLHELARRTTNGLIVRLLWDAALDRIVRRYRDPIEGDFFTAAVPSGEAMAAFRHPNAYRPA
jgi:hypothetical protein